MVRSSDAIVEGRGGIGAVVVVEIEEKSGIDAVDAVKVVERGEFDAVVVVKVEIKRRAR
jgi:hypothetical protein